MLWRSVHITQVYIVNVSAPHPSFKNIFSLQQINYLKPDKDDVTNAPPGRLAERKQNFCSLVFFPDMTGWESINRVLRTEHCQRTRASLVLDVSSSRHCSHHRVSNLESNYDREHQQTCFLNQMVGALWNSGRQGWSFSHLKHQHQ